VSKICSTVLDAIGNTPLVRLNRVTDGLEVRVLCKLEMFNPSASIKIRPAYWMIETAERQGKLKPGMTIVEPTSGNQGIGLACVGAVKGYEVIVCVPEFMSVERRQIAEAYGATVVLTPREQDVEGAVKKAREIVASDPGKFFMPDQFANPANPDYHSLTTGKEILEQVGGPIDALIAGVGTGGTLTGIARVLKKAWPHCKAYAVEPVNSAVISGSKPGFHKLQGIGDGFIPENLDLGLCDGPILVTDDDALNMACRLAKEEGILCGISSGANVWAALKTAGEIGKDATVVTIIPDTGERYLSTDLFQS
jgi:cysteine synthase A